MCIDPITLIGAAISAVGSGIGIAQQAAGQRQQAQMYDRQAAQERIAGSFRAQREEQQVRQAVGQGIAASSASGLQLTGTTGQAVRDIGTEGALDVGATRFNTRVAADNAAFQAAQARANAKNTMIGLPFAVAAPLINAASGAMKPNAPPAYDAGANALGPGGPVFSQYGAGGSLYQPIGTSLRQGSRFYRPRYVG